jgi:hydroxymethylpyrimidine pyrophosphatase-like HAD family hydrolase
LGADVQHEPGKFTHFTLVVSPPTRPADLLEAAENLAAQFPGWWRVEVTKSCVHFLFQHLHKGTGVEWLASMTGIGLEEMAGIGDARPDIPFLSQVGIACAPGNAHPDVKAVAHWTSPLEDAEATIEFMDRVVDHNRALTRAEILAGSASSGRLPAAEDGTGEVQS